MATKHKWKCVISFDGETTERFTVCDGCGTELNDQNEDDECEEDTPTEPKSAPEEK